MAHAMNNSPYIFAINKNKGDNIMQKEGMFKTKLVARIERDLPGSMVLHLNPQECQGIPDLLILYKDRWATLEGKESLEAPYRPNQEYYIGMMNDMSYSSMICPEIEEKVLSEMYAFFEN